MYKVIISIMLSSTITFLNADDNKAQDLFKTKCLSCHVYYRPDDISKLVAPPIKGVVRHLRSNFSSQKEIIEHVKDFVINPTKEKAICPSVGRFGLMPSQKDLVSKEELEIITKWMLNKF